MLTLTEKNIINSPYTFLAQHPLTKTHNHTFWEIFIFLGDKLSHTINDTTSVALLGDVFFLRPNKDFHCFNLEPKKRKRNSFHRHRDIYVDDADMKKWCALLSPTLYDELTAAKNPLKLNISLSTINHIEDLLISHNSNQHQNVVLKNSHLSAVITLLTLLNNSQTPPMPTQWLNTFIDTLSNPENFSVSIEQLIASIPYSHCHICREFKKHTGQTVINYFISKKVNYASYLLANTNMRISDISNLIGYTSPKNFISQFTKTFKMPPSKWRAKAQITAKK